MTFIRRIRPNLTFIALACLLPGCASFNPKTKARDQAAYEQALRTGICHVHGYRMEKVSAPLVDAPDPAPQRGWYFHTRLVGGTDVFIQRTSSTGKIWTCWRCEKDAITIDPPIFPIFPDHEVIPRRKF